MDYYKFSWNGARFEWKSESWPHFEGRSPAGWYAKISPDGMRWEAEIQLKGGKATGRGATPQEALDAARGVWQKTVELLGAVN